MTHQLSLFQTGAGAVIAGTYRYSLWRIWDEQRHRVLFILLNPSTADESSDDNTLRRCIGFAKSWGYGSLEIVNLFALRSTDPMALKEAADPIGPLNDQSISQAAGRTALIVCG